MTFWTGLLLNAIIGGALSTIVGVVVGFLFKRWLRTIFEPQQQATTEAAHRAASRAGEAAVASREASKDAKSASDDAKAAGENSRQANEALGFVGETLGDSVAEARRMARRLDDFLTANLQLRTILTQHGIPIPETARINGVVTGEVEAQTITGKHRLHSPEKLRFQTIDETPPE